MILKFNTEEILKSTTLNVSDNEGYIPYFFRLTIVEDAEKLQELLQNRPWIKVYDELRGQLKELVKLRNPSKQLTEMESEEKISVILDGCAEQDYGVWVYYPWIDKLVHILDEKEFVEVRTSRNIYKITPEERDILMQKKIGVIGLSVGQSIALTLIMERVCGEVRLADFDRVELSNMNRIRVGIHDLNVKKVVCAAREIAEIDPFIKVRCYDEGASESNIDDFMTSNGKLDVLVEECDGVDMKIISRLKARELGIPVVMDMNDRGMLDIERFDLEPERPLFHGLMEHLDLSDPSKLRHLSNQQKLEYLGPMCDVFNMSERMKYSLSQLGKTITTWPQLASSVVLGGAMVTDTCRRILLGSLETSGRYYVDFEKLIV
ncbi:ThiF family adenylyltransferase [Solitalea koreensis]|uniref:ThiF family protein n=1 Tax=Solitalea koreensis TaxID=543615 RepID=A0A521ED32_9SPHI|nr:ThiF family adenylyltransferase [Solitalea koreensis]SMO81351.1 ThiF family protein [Solitalea koreensis]